MACFMEQFSCRLESRAYHSDGNADADGYQHRHCDGVGVVGMHNGLIVAEESSLVRASDEVDDQDQRAH